MKIDRGDLQRVKAELGKFERTADKKFFSEIGMFIAHRIKERTVEQGKDADGSAFKPYSPRYKLFRESLGLPTKPDLFLTGTMMGAMAYDATDTRLKVFMNRTTNPSTIGSGKKKKKLSQQPSSAKAFWLHQERPFFRLNQKDIDMIMDMFQKRLDSL